MIRKWLLSLTLLAVVACTPRTEGPDADLTAMTGDELLQSRIAVSPDGARLAYAMQIEGMAAIYVAGADGSNPVRLTHGIWDNTPVWSPDGNWIAYYSDDNADVWMVPSAGGESRQLTSGPASDLPIGWLPDGSGVIFRRGGVGDDQTLVAPIDGGPARPLFTAPDGNVTADLSPDGSKVAFLLGREGRTTLWVQDMPAGPARQLTTDGLEGARLGRMWSPDGSAVLYTTRRTGTTDIWSANVETGELRQLTQDIRNDWDAVWSPDGRWVTFYSDRGGQRDLWVVASEGGAAHRVTADLAYEGPPDWSPDGRTIYFVSIGLSVAIDAMGADGGPSRTLVGPAGYNAFDINISPDGRTALFVSNRSGDFDIWSVPVAGGEPSQLAAGPVVDYQPAWSPDGNWVAFTSLRGGGTEDIWVVPGEGGEPRQLTDWPSNENAPRWSPDGSTIAFASTRDATQPELWTIPAAGGPATRITRTNAGVGQIRWAPDGRTLFYDGATADGSRQLFRVPAAGGAPRVLTHATGGASIGNIAVSPDGEQVAYAYFTAGLAFLEVVPAAGGAARRFTSDSTREWRIEADWSPDGSKILVSEWNYATNRSNLVTVSFPQGEIRRLTTTTDAWEGNPHWTPDGQSVLFYRDRSTHRLMAAGVRRLLGETQR